MGDGDLDERPLLGLTVVELGQFFTVQAAGGILAQLGAQVTKIEPLGGEAGRRLPPLKGDQSVAFATFQHGKHTLELDLRSDAGAQAVRDLVDAADVVVDNLRPKALRRLGLSDEPVGPRASGRAVWCSIRGGSLEPDGSVGSAGRVVDVTVQAASGLSWLIGTPDAPGRLPLPVIDLTAALIAVTNILAARAQGRGARIVVTMTAAAAWLEAPVLAAHRAGLHVAPLGRQNYFVAPNGIYRTADGHVAVAVFDDASFARVTEAFALRSTAAWRDDLLAADRRREYRDVVDGLLADALATRDTAAAIAALATAGASVAPVNDLARALRLPDVHQLVHTDKETGLPWVAFPAAVPTATEGDGRDLPAHPPE